MGAKLSGGLGYRHTGQPEVDDNLLILFGGPKTDRDILRSIGTHHITHMHVSERRVPSLKVVAPHLKVLRIEENFEHTRKHFSLKSLELPPELEELWITSYQLSHSFPKSIARCTSLEKLRLQSCKLRNLPQSLSSLHNLRVLEIDDSKLLNGSPDVIGDLTSLETLKLVRCHLQDLPASLSSLHNLRVLDLNSNELLNGLPAVIGGLTSLETLNLAQCHLQDLPTSLSSLHNLKVLDVSANRFSNGLPDVIGDLTSLERLILRQCDLQHLPTSFIKLTKLEWLDLSSNRFCDLPIQVCELRELTVLHLNKNDQIKSLQAGILNLSKLTELDTSGCRSLTMPSANVCVQGLEAIKQYYKDLEKGKGRSLPAATVSVIGKSRAGKTSLIRTLQQNTRVLSGSVGKEEDVSTKVFNFEEVEIENTKLRFIDFGGQEIYHLAYGLTLRENCVPVIVVNMEMYKEMSEKIGDREAVRRLYFDWMAHLYLSQPDLPAPKLVITHKDKFSVDQFMKLKLRFLATSNGVRDTILSEESRLLRQDFHQITHFMVSREIFQEEDIFEVGLDDDNHTFDNLKQQLHECCMLHVMQVPRIWEDVEQRLNSLPSGFSLFDDLLSQLSVSHDVDKEQLEVILTYMHLCGKLLWYKDENVLQRYVFHKISSVIKLLNVLLDHDDSAKWERRSQHFCECQIQSQDFTLERYEYSVERFKETGIISQVLLAYLIRSETEFASIDELAISVALLTTFRLVFGPVTTDSKPSYIVPHFAVGYFSDIQPVNSQIQLHVDLLFKGLSLPEYVYHEMTVGLLELFSSEMDDLCVLHNGATVDVNESAIRLTHDSKAAKASVVVLSPIKDIEMSWDQLIAVVNNTTRHILSSWKAARLECVFYCAHCILNRSPHPRRIISPSWCLLSTTTKAEDSTDAGLKMVKCGNERVASAFRFPCKSLSDADKETLLQYATSLNPKGQKQPKKPKLAAVALVEKPSNRDASLAVCSFNDIVADLNNSDFQVTLTEDEAIKELYDNTDQVYKMTSPRGMALVINNIDFSQDSSLPVRTGSGIDVRNIEKMLPNFNFVMKTETNLSGKEMLSAIESVTQQSDLEDHGMFVLVLMSHGGENDLIFGTDGMLIDLHDVFYMLSSHNFPAMAKKPKMVIVQACGGVLGDYGHKGSKEATSLKPFGMTVRPRTGSGRHPFGTTAHSSVEIDHLNTDDLIVMKASFNTYASIRHDKWGSPFISYLVHNFYKHACDTDVKTLFEMIQRDVRAETIKLANKYPDDCYGQAPFCFSMLTDLRKLYLFPGYNGE